MNKILSIISILFLINCSDRLNQDFDGPSALLLYPESGYVASDSVQIQFEIKDKSQIFDVYLRIFGNGPVKDYEMNNEFSTPNIWFYTLNVTGYESSSIRIQAIAIDEYNNEGTSSEIEIFIDSTLKFINIPAGPYIDSDNIETEIPFDFQMMKYPVTLKQYLIFLNEAIESEEIIISNNKIRGFIEGEMRDFLAWGDSSYIHHLGAITIENNQFIAMDASYNDHPITGITWYGAKAFADYYKMRLPSVSEWEKVARGIDGYIYPWGNYNNEQRSNFHQSSDPWESGTTPVGYYNGINDSTENSQSAFGAYDMAGNIWEWTTEYIHGFGYVLKGGSYQNLAFSQTTTNENTSFPQYIREHFGFRCVRDF